VNFVVTAKARSAIRHYLKGLRRTEAISLGQRLLDQALAEFNLSLKEVSAESLQAALGELGTRDLDDLYEKVGLGERLAPLVARRLLPAGPHDSTGAPLPLPIAGAEGLLVTSARCCYPLPNDPIIAFLSSGRGIVIHRENCVNVEDYRKHPEKWLPVTWQIAPDRHFSSEIRVDAANRTGVLAAVAAAIASTDTNIDHVSVETRDEDTSVLIFEIKVKNRKHLARIVRIIRRMPDVLRVTRTLAAHARDHGHKFQEHPKSPAS
jgi:GTP pyrophosphokinase